jgi:hypothetical protein
MTTQELITEIKSLHGAISTMRDKSTMAGQNTSYLETARTNMATAINQLLIHQHWFGDADTIGSATAPLASVASAKVSVAPSPTAAPSVQSVAK